MSGLRPALRAATLAFALGFVLAACGLKLPRDFASYETGCRNSSGDTAPANTVFFISSRQRDCRGEALRFVDFRATHAVYGENELNEKSPRPWADFVSHTYEPNVWFRRVASRLDHGDNDGRLLIFVHGYNNDFSAVNERAVWLSRLYYSGVPVVVVHWPSRNRTQSYLYDEDSVQWAQDYLDELLEKLVPEAKQVVIVGHSMGTRAVLAAVDHLDRADKESSKRIVKVVLASPDIDRDQALRSNGLIERLLRTENRQVLVYASFRDRALKSSRFVHGYERLGSSNCAFDVSPERRKSANRTSCSRAPTSDRLAIVETGNVDAPGLLNHADFVESCFVRYDLALFLRSNTRPSDYPWRRTVSADGRTGYVIDREAFVGHDPCATDRDLLAGWPPPPK